MVDLARRPGSAIDFNSAGFCIISATFLFDARSSWLSLDRKFVPPRHKDSKKKIRSRSPQISQKDADFEIQIGEIGVICGSLLPFLVSFRDCGGFKQRAFVVKNLPGNCPPAILR